MIIISIVNKIAMNKLIFILLYNYYICYLNLLMNLIINK